MSKVVYRKNGGRRRAGYPLLVLCAVLLFGFSLVNIVWPKRTQLELENRKAASELVCKACKHKVVSSGPAPLVRVIRLWAPQVQATWAICNRALWKSPTWT